MEPIPPLQVPLGARAVIIAEDQPEYFPIPALIFDDGRVLIEWSFTPEERQAIACGENLRHEIYRSLRCACGRPRLFEPLRFTVTTELHG